MEKIRLRAFAIIVATLIAAVGVIAWSTLPAWPVSGVGVAVVMVAINRVAVRLDQPVCLGCGGAMHEEPVGVHGSICPRCGSINQPFAGSDDSLQA